MGQLIEGRWRDHAPDTGNGDGRFRRTDARFRNWVTKDGAAGPTGDRGFKAERDRYHLYASFACPWAHRALIYRELKKLTSIVPVSVVHWHMGEHGWTFAEGEGVVPDPIHDAGYLYEVYQAAVSDYTGKVTVPVLWDRQQATVVNNESADIIRMFNSAFDEVGAARGDYYPPALREEIDMINKRVYETVNNGVYKAGFASTQEAYEEAVGPLFETLGWLDARLAKRRYLAGSRVTEADWRLFTSLVRFDPVYFGHFKCNQRRLVDFRHLWPYARDLYQHPGVAGTVHLDHIKAHYYTSHPTINPAGIVPVGPEIDYGAEHGRERLAA